MPTAEACASAAAGGAIEGVLAAVECRSREVAQLGYESLTSPASPYGAALTLLLVIYVATLGYRMLLAPDGVRLTDTPTIALKVGAVLALVASWSTFETLVFALVDSGPREIGRAIVAPLSQSAALASEPVAGAQILYDEMQAAAEAFARTGPPSAQPYASAGARTAEALSGAARALFLATAGALSVARIAVAVLCAAGPVFIALFLFTETRGFFVGWVRALAAAAIAPMVGWVVLAMMLLVVEPDLVVLARQVSSGELDPDLGQAVALTVQVFSLAQIALVVGSVTIATGFGLGRSRRAVVADGPPPAAARAGGAGPAESSRAERWVETVRTHALRETTLAAAHARTPTLSVPAPAVSRPPRWSGEFRRPAPRGRDGAKP